MTKGLVCLALLLAQPAEQPALPKPKTFNLSADQTKLSAVLAELSRKSGVTVEDKRGEADEPITLTAKDTTLWSAIDAVAAAAHAGVTINPRDGRVNLVKRMDKDEGTAVSHDGLFRAVVKRVTAVHDFDTGDSVYTASVEIAWEPWLLPLFLETSPRALKVKDESGKDLPVRQEGSSLAAVDGRTAFLLELPLPTFGRDAKKIGQVQGSLSVIAPSRMLHLSFDSLDQLEKKAPVAVTQDGMTCKITKVVLNNDRWSVQVALDYPPGGPTFESFQSWVVNNEMTLQSKDGSKRLSSNSYVLESSSSRKAVLTYHFTDKGRGRPEEWKVTYRTPASIVEIPFTFAFKDVRLP
jgi:hypothetical protein